MEDQEFLKEKTLPQMLQWQKTRSGSTRIALRKKDFGIWKQITWDEYLINVRNVTLGLEKLGFGKNQKLALLGENNPEMLYMELGAQALGGVSVGVYQTSLPKDIEYVIEYTDVTFVFADDQEQVDKLISLREKIPAVKKVFYEDPKGMREYQKEDWFMSIYDLMKLGEAEHQKHPQRFEEHTAQGKSTDVCHFCMTSGTTGNPKAAMLTHKNLINMGISLTAIDPLTPTDEYASFLPFAWIGEQMVSIGVALVSGVSVNFPEETETAMADLKEIGPHIMFGAPRLWEGIRSQVWLKIDESYRFNRWVYQTFMEIGRKAAEFSMKGKKLPFKLKLGSWIGEYLVFRPLRNQLGLLRLRRAYTGGAALGPDLFTFFQGMGVNLKQIYGQTEIIGIAYVHRDGDIKADTVGLPIPGTECKISEEGEIISKSDSVCEGYYKKEKETQEAIQEGWLHSGDAGYFDQDGHLVVIDRLSDVMHTKQGEMFSPMFLENKLKFSPYIKEAVVWGNQEDYISSFINVDPTTIGKWAEDRGISYTTYMDLSQKKEIADLVAQEIQIVNHSIEKENQRIKRFVLLFKLLDIDDGELTQTGKIRRKFIRDRYAELVEALYEPETTIKQIQTTFQYQDGQKASVETEVQLHTLGGNA